MSNVEYIGRVYRAGKRSGAAASARSHGEDGPASAFGGSSPRPVIRGESPLRSADRTAIAASLPEGGFVRLSTILALLPISRATWWRGVKRGAYPPAVKLGPKTTAWRAEDIRAVMRRIVETPEQGIDPGSAPA